MEYNDWYERYQKYQAQQNPQPKKKKGVSIAALVAAVLVAALVAGVAGGFVTSAYLGKTQASALPEQQQAALPENSDPQPEKKPSVLTEAPASSQGSSLLQNGTAPDIQKHRSSRSPLPRSSALTSRSRTRIPATTLAGASTSATAPRRRRRARAAASSSRATDTSSPATMSLTALPPLRSRLMMTRSMTRRWSARTSATILPLSRSKPRA